ncbi:MAG: threonine dehydratase [bacterium]|nr:threonine dehydratase [bacterium]
MVTADQLNEARKIVYASMQPTLQTPWPLLQEHLGVEVWVKHENHTPTGAFKVRGGLVLMAQRQRDGLTNGIVSATRGNHGQSLPFAARQYNIPVTIVVPKGNSVEKNKAMQGLGATLVEFGQDFNEAFDHAIALSDERQLDLIGSFIPELVQGVSTYGAELFEAADELDTVYVPIGMGSGICSLIGVRDLMGLKTGIVGVVSQNANAYALSYKTGAVTATNSADTFADGIAVRIPHPAALEIILKGADRIVEVTDGQIAQAMRLYFTHTHNIAEGAGAAALAGLIMERDKLQGKRAGVILTGGNIDMDLYQKVLAKGI